MADNEVAHSTVTAADGRDLRILVSGEPSALPVVIYMGTPSGLLPLPSQIDLGRGGAQAVLHVRALRQRPQHIAPARTAGHRSGV